MKKIIFLLVLMIAIFASCSAQNILDDEIVDIAIEPPYEFIPEQIPIYATEPPVTAIVTLQPHSCSCQLTPIRGVIIDFYGPVSEYGTVPWDNEWFEIEIEKEDGTPAIIVGMHYTQFFFDGKPTSGTEITAYISYDSPVFVNTPPLYIATAVFADNATGILFCCNGLDEETSFIISRDTYYFEFSDGHVPRLDTLCKRAEWCTRFQRFVNEAEREGFLDGRVILYTYYDGLPIMRSIIPLSDNVPMSFWARDEYNESPITLAFTDYIFPANAFETLDLPIFVNNIELDAPPPILYSDGITILVPFRRIFAAGVGFGNYAYITHNGDLMFGGGGGGSENSHWQVGRDYWRGIGCRTVPMCAPAIIVGGIIYVPLLTGIGRTPFSGAWVFPERLDAFGESFSPFGPWVNWPQWHDNAITDEEFAAFTIVINGVEMDSSPPVFTYSERRHGISITLNTIVEGFGYTFVREEDDFVLFHDEHGEEIWLWPYVVNGEAYVIVPSYYFVSTLYDGQVLIKRRL